MRHENTVLETGDIILTSRNKLVARFMALFQKDPVYWGHVGIAKDNKSIWEAQMWLRETEKQKFFNNYKHYKIIRKINLTEQQKVIMRKTAPKLIGRFYGVKRIFLQFLDQIFYTNKFTNKHTSKYNQVCSSYVAWVYWIACKYKFNNLSWRSIEPDDIEDDQLLNSKQWGVLKIT